jgi:hypothetical protein
MGYVIFAILFALITLWHTRSRIQVRLQTVDKATDHVLVSLAQGDPHGRGGPSKVQFWATHPLSRHMIKEVAASAGYDYHGEGVVAGGARALEFTRRPGMERKLQLFD